MYFLFISFKILFEPAWTGRWSCLQTLSHSAIASISLSLKSFGCDVINLIRSTPSMSFTIRIRSAKSTSVSRSLPYEFTFCPKSAISLQPLATSSLTSAITASGVRLLSRPRTYGTIQYEQKLLQPYITDTHAFLSSSRIIGISSAIAPSLLSISTTVFFSWIALYKSSGIL